ncbi:MAG: universal stress protein [Arenicellales bacterium]
MKKILVGIDLRVKNAWFVTRAADLARCIDGRVDMLYVSHKESGAEQAQRRKALEDLLAHLAEDRRGDVLVISGEPRKVLREQSGNYHMMVVGPREPAGWRKLVEDAMAIQLIGDARCPVFVPRTDEPKASFQRLLMGLDLHHGNPALRLQQAGDWAATLNATLDATYCESTPGRYLPKESPGRVSEETWHTNREKDEQTVKRLMRENLPAPARGKGFVSLGRVTECLVGLSSSYDLIVVGTADAVRHNILISPVAVDIVRKARCDVLILP